MHFCSFFVIVAFGPLRLKILMYLDKNLKLWLSVKSALLSAFSYHCLKI